MIPRTRCGPYRETQIPLADRRQDGVKYIDLDEQKVFDPSPAIQLIKEILGETGKYEEAIMMKLASRFLLFSRTSRSSHSARPCQAAELKTAARRSEATLKAARAEKEVAVFCEPTPDRAKCAKGISERLITDIQLKLNPSARATFGTRLLAERRAGKYLADVFSGGTTTPSQVWCRRMPSNRSKAPSSYPR